MNETIEPQTAVEIVRPEEPQPVAIQDQPKPLTSQQARVVEVSEALTPAYQKAATLDLNDTEVAALMVNFPDEMVEIRPHDGLIFIPHIHISDRLNRVFRPGQWALVRRREWFDQGSSTMYGEYVLIIKGCYVGEAVGGHPYVPTNPKVNFSDTLESTAAEALRRIAGKRLSCGSQVWNPEYARQWVQKYAVKINNKWERRFAKDPDPAPPAPKPPTTASDVLPNKPTEATRKWMIDGLLEIFEPDQVWGYGVSIGAIKDAQTLDEWALGRVPTSKQAMAELVRAIGEFIGPSENPDELPPEIGNVVIHIPPAGVDRTTYLKSPDSISSLYAQRRDDPKARERLFGFMAKFDPKGYTKENGEHVPPSQDDLKLRAALDALAAFREAKGDK